MATQTDGYKAKALEPRNLAFFFLIALGLSWARQALLFFGILKAPAGTTDPTILLFTLATWGPTVAAFLMTAMTEGKSGIRTLWKRFWNRDLSAKWLAVILLFFPALWFAGNLVYRTLDAEPYPFLDQPRQFISAFVAALFNGLSEEFGWRGYVLPRIQAKWSALVSSIMLGLIWASWHTEVFTGIVLNSLSGRVRPQADTWDWAVGMVILSVFMTWVFNNTNGSVLAAILFHAMWNSAAVLFFCCGGPWRWDALLLLAAASIVIIFGPRSLTRHKPQDTQ
jgi:membrane protease YdiL (CAAX protease family)